MKISIIIPAHNEEKYIGKCIDSIYKANENYLFDIEIIVVLNRCTDNTERIALQKNAKVVINDDRNLSKIRNAGARASSGEIIVTIDSDSIMSDNVLSEISKALTTGKYMGGGINVKPERYSPGIRTTYAILKIFLFITGFSGGMFWLNREDFELLGGFDESLILGEDYDFAIRMKKHARKNKLKYGDLPNGYLITSCRKFDSFGDWHMIKMFFKDFKKLYKCVNKKNTEFADQYFFDFN